jgi:hypothetical protein
MIYSLQKNSIPVIQNSMAPRYLEYQPRIGGKKSIRTRRPNLDEEYNLITERIINHRNFVLLYLGFVNLKFPSYVSLAKQKQYSMAMLVITMNIIICHIQMNIRGSRKFISDYWAVFHCSRIVRTIVQQQILS